LSGQRENARDERHALGKVTAIGEEARERFRRVCNHKSSDDQATRRLHMTEPGRNAFGDVPDDGRLLSGCCNSAGRRRLNQPRWRPSDAIVDVTVASWNASCVATTTSSNFKLGSFGMAKPGASHFVTGAVTHRCYAIRTHLCSCVRASNTVLQTCNVVTVLRAVWRHGRDAGAIFWMCSQWLEWRRSPQLLSCPP